MRFLFIKLAFDPCRCVGYFVWWLSGYIGVVIGFKIASRLLPSVSCPFFSDLKGMVFVTIFFTLAFVISITLLHVRRKIS
jgi:uncharacterized membrane protein YhaH (DUF805 family)